MKRILFNLVTKKVTIAKWQLNLIVLISFSAGIVFTFGYLLNQYWLPKIFAASSPWTQTDWSGGATASVATGTVTTYDSLSTTDPTTSAGNLTLSATSSWYNSSWKYRRKITLDNTTATLGVTSEALTNFPVLVKLTSSNVDYSNTQDSGQDLRFTDSDGTTLLSYEIEKWDETGTSYVWVKVPSVDINSSTDNIYAYYGNSGASDGQAATSVWDSNYKAVYHLKETGNGTANEFVDSTSNGIHGFGGGTIGASGVPTVTTSGQIGNAQTFDGGDTIKLNSTTGLMKNLSQYTIEAWAKPSSLPGSGSTADLYHEAPNGNEAQSRALFGYTQNGALCTGLKGLVRFRKDSSTSNVNVCSSTTPSTATWYYQVGVFDATNDSHKFYLFTGGSGGLETTSTSAQDAVENADAAANPHLGSSSVEADFYSGVIDELRVSTSVRTLAWIKAGYLNMYGSSFASFGSQEERYASTGTLNSVVFDAGAGGSFWGTFSYTVTANGATTAVKVRTSNSSTMVGATAFASCSAITSGADISANGCVTDGHRYLQYQVTLTSVTANTPTFQDISLAFAPYDTTAPITNASALAMKRVAAGATVASNGWANNLAPYFSWTAGADDVGGIGLLGYCLYLGTDNTADPATSKGLLGTSPVSTSGTTCQFIVSSTSIDFATSSYRGDTWLTSSSSPYYLSIKAVDSAGNIFATSAQSQFRFENTSPTNVAYISCASGNFSSVDDMSFSWPTSGGNAASDATSGMLGWQYQINSTAGTWLGTTTESSVGLGNYMPTSESSRTLTTAQDGGSIASGSNVLYFRAVDVAGNAASDASVRTCNLNYGGAAPSFGGTDTVTVTPSTASTNSYALSWPAATAADGQTVSAYYYMINTAPPSSYSTLSGNATTYINNGTTRTVAAAALSNVNKGLNTVYVVAVDNTSPPNYSSSNYISGTFTLNSTDPDNVGNLFASDSSIKSQSQWNVTLTWTAPTYQGAGNLTYLIYRSSDGTSFSQVGSSSGLSYVDNAPTSNLFYYKVYTKDGANSTSSGTNAVSLTPTGKWTSAPGLSSGPSSGSVTQKKATISWSTDRTSDSKVQFGTKSNDYSSIEPSNSTQVSSHSIDLTGLVPGTTYYYKVKWTDEDGNTGTSDEKTFTTADPPSVKDVSVTHIGLSSAIVQYTAKNASKVKIFYGKTTSFGGSKEISTSVTETAYSTELIGLEDGAKYYYKIDTFDSDGAVYEGTVLDFTTLPRPRITGVRIQQVNNTAQSTLLVSWTTNTEVSSVVTYYPENSPENAHDEVNVALLKGEHKMIIRSLQPQTDYTLIVRGKDKAGNEASSDPQRLTTATDTRPPQVSELNVEGTNIPAVQGTAQEQIAQLVVSWVTDEPSTSQVEFGEGSGSTYAQKTQEDVNLTLNHLVIISNLTTSKVYHLRTISKDKANNIGNSIDTVTITPKSTGNALNLVISNLQQVFGFLGGN